MTPRQSTEHTLGKPGKLPWATWPMALIPDLAKLGNVDLLAKDSPFSGLKRQMTLLSPDPDMVSSQALEAIAQLDKLIEGLESGKLDANRLAPLIKELATRRPDPGVSWDVATQTYLAKQGAHEGRSFAQRPGAPGDVRPLEVSGAAEALRQPTERRIKAGSRTLTAWLRRLVVDQCPNRGFNRPSRRGFIGDRPGKVPGVGSDNRQGVDDSTRT